MILAALGVMHLALLLADSLITSLVAPKGTRS